MTNGFDAGKIIQSYVAGLEIKEKKKQERERQLNQLGIIGIDKKDVPDQQFLPQGIIDLGADAEGKRWFKIPTEFQQKQLQFQQEQQIAVGARRIKVSEEAGFFPMKSAFEMGAPEISDEDVSNRIAIAAGVTPEGKVRPDFNPFDIGIREIVGAVARVGKGIEKAQPFKSTDFYSDRVQFHLSQGLPLGQAQLKAKDEEKQFSVETAQAKRQEDIIKKGQLATLKAGADADAIPFIRNTRQEYAINPLGVEPPPAIPQKLIAQVSDSLFQARLAASGLLTDEDLKRELEELRRKQKQGNKTVVDVLGKPKK